jgi:hypothetical protein
MSSILLIQDQQSDGSQVFVDSSASARNITAVGNTQWDDAEYKYAPTSVYFDNVGDKLQCAASPDFSLGSVYWIEFWVKRASISRDMVFGDSVSASSPGNCFRAEFNSTGFDFYVNGSNWTTTGVSVSDITTWHHIAIGSDGTTMYAFLDGILSGTRSTLVIGDSGAPFVVGEQTADTSGSLYFHGWIWRFMILKDECLYTSNFTPDASPVPTVAILMQSFRAVHGDSITKSLRISHGLFPQVLKLFRALPGAAPLRSKTFRVVHDQARSFVKIMRVVHQQSTFIQKVFRVVHQQKNGDLIKVIRVVHGTKAGEAVLKIFRAIHGLVAGSFRGDTFDVSLRVGNQPVLSWSAATLSTDEGRFVWEAQVTVHQQWDAETLLGQYDQVVYRRYGTDYHLIVVDRSRAAVIGDDEYTDAWTVQLASPAYRLAAGTALPVTKTWPRGTAAKAIVQELCDAKSITLDWQAPEYVLAELVADKQSPIDIIRAVCNVIGALPQSAPSGELVVRKETPVMPDSKAVPVATFAALSIVQLAEQSDDPAVLYNAVQVSDSTEPGDDAGGLQHVETDRTDGGKDIQAWSEPWAEVALRVNSAAGQTALSSGKLVVADYLDKDGEPEWVQFVDGKATASRPVYQGFSVVDFRGDGPGSISWQPDSKELVASNGGEYYVQISYQWRYYEFVYYSNTGDDYQVILND